MQGRRVCPATQLKHYALPVPVNSSSPLPCTIVYSRTEVWCSKSHHTSRRAYLFHLFSCTTGRTSAGKGNSSCSSTETLQPAPANSSLPHTQPPFLHQNSTPIAASTKKTAPRKRSLQSSIDPSQRMLEQYIPTSTHPAGISEGNSSTEQAASDQHGTGMFSQCVLLMEACSCVWSSSRRHLTSC